MKYSDDANWDITIELPTGAYKYTYVVLNDFQPNGGMPLWECRIDRDLAASQTDTDDVWGVCSSRSLFFQHISSQMGPKVQMCEMPGLPGPIWRSPMPFSRMFDPNGTVYNELKAQRIDTIVCLAHRGVSKFYSLSTLRIVCAQECDYHTGRDLTALYVQERMQVLNYPIDDLCVPRDVKAFRDFVQTVYEVCMRDECALP